MLEKRKRKEVSSGWLLKRSEADKFYLFCFLSCKQLNTLPCFLCRVTKESGACPHIILFKRKGRTKAKNTEQAPLPCALCLWSCHPNLPVWATSSFLVTWEKVEQDGAAKASPSCACFWRPPFFSFFPFLFFGF